MFFHDQTELGELLQTCGSSEEEAELDINSLNDEDAETKEECRISEDIISSRASISHETLMCVIRHLLLLISSFICVYTLKS